MEFTLFISLSLYYLLKYVAGLQIAPYSANWKEDKHLEYITNEMRFTYLCVSLNFEIFIIIMVTLTRIHL